MPKGHNPKRLRNTLPDELWAAMSPTEKVQYSIMLNKEMNNVIGARQRAKAAANATDKFARRKRNEQIEDDGEL